jgi:hypothetical protein
MVWLGRHTPIWTEDGFARDGSCSVSPTWRNRRVRRQLDLIQMVILLATANPSLGRWLSCWRRLGAAHLDLDQRMVLLRRQQLDGDQRILLLARATPNLGRAFRSLTNPLIKSLCPLGLSQATAFAVAYATAAMLVAAGDKHSEDCLR